MQQIGRPGPGKAPGELVSRRRRAILLLGAAAGAGLLAMILVSGYSSSVADSYGDLQPVVVIERDLEAGHQISPELAHRVLAVRRVPTRFLPALALADPVDAIGLEVSGPMPAGSYLTGNLLRPPGADRPQKPRAGRGRQAVELAVSGAGALTGVSGRVDVLVTSEPTTGGRGRTTVAASAVPLITIGRTGASDAGPGLTQVTLGLTRKEAVRLIQAESFARRVTVLPRGGR